MWRKQVARIRLLRVAAAEQPHEPATLDQDVHLRVMVFADVRDGDLDGFVSGICDGLQPAPANFKEYLREADWTDVPEAAQPHRALGFTDDRAISRIEAVRHPPEGSARYEVALTWC
jgi:hypothetical protein